MSDNSPLGQEPAVTETQPDEPQDGAGAAQPTAAGQEPETFDADYVAKLRNEAAKYRTQARDTQKAMEDLKSEFDELRKGQESAKKKELAEQGKYKELFEESAATIQKLEAKAAELSGLNEKVTKYQETITGLLESQREGLPESIVTLLDKLDPVEQLEWLAKNKKEVAKPKGAPALSEFNPSGAGGNPENDAQRVSRLRRNTGQMVTPFG